MLLKLYLVKILVVGAHRRRSNTAVRLERMKKEKRNQVKVKQRTWKDSDTKLNGI